MVKQFLFGKDAREALYRGASLLARAVVTTLGPRGRNVALDRKFQFPVVLHDGVSVSKEIELENVFDNIGAQLIKEAASKTNDQAGDGTTTATLLARVIIEEGIKYVELGYNPMVLKEEIDEAVRLVVAEVKKHSKSISTLQEIEQVAKISTQKEELGKMVAEAVYRVGKDGVVTVEEGSGIKTEIKYTEGMSFDRGYSASYFVTNAEKSEAELMEPFILLSEKKIISNNDLFPFLKKLSDAGLNNLVIIGEVEGEALATLVWNKLKGRLESLVISPPAFGDRRLQILEDIGVLTGGKVLRADLLNKLEDVKIEDLGRADKVWCSDKETRIVGGRGEKVKIEERIKQIKVQIDKSESEFEKEKLKERVARLGSGCSVISVGAPTELEMKELKERAIDAVGSCRAAISEGVVVGGGVTLLKARRVLYIPNPSNGFQVVFKALGQPIRVLLENAGVERVDKIIDTIVEDESVDYGFNVVTKKYCSLSAEGIIDPIGVVVATLVNSSSVASLVLTTDCLVADLPQEDTRKKASEI